VLSLPPSALLSAVRRLLAALVLAVLVALGPAAVAHAGPSDGHSDAGHGLLNLSNNGDSLLEIDRTLNLNFGGHGGNAGSDNDN